MKKTLCAPCVCAGGSSTDLTLCPQLDLWAQVWSDGGARGPSRCPPEELLQPDAWGWWVWPEHRRDTRSLTPPPSAHRADRSHTHTHTHTNTHTHTHTHRLTLSLSLIGLTHTNTHTDSLSLSLSHRSHTHHTEHTHTQTHSLSLSLTGLTHTTPNTHTHTHTHTDSLSLSLSQVSHTPHRTHTNTHTQTHSLSLSHRSHTHHTEHTHTQTHSLSLSLTGLTHTTPNKHTHTHTHTHRLTLSLSHRSHTHHTEHTHTHTHTHTQTHSLSLTGLTHTTPNTGPFSLIHSDSAHRRQTFRDQTCLFCLYLQRMNFCWMPWTKKTSSYTRTGLWAVFGRDAPIAIFFGFWFLPILILFAYTNFYFVCLYQFLFCLSIPIVVLFFLPIFFQCRFFFHITCVYTDFCRFRFYI